MWYVIQSEGVLFADRSPRCMDKEKVVRAFRTLRELAFCYPDAFMTEDDMPTLIRAGEKVSFVNN